jgi:hypothetical protein
MGEISKSRTVEHSWDVDHRTECNKVETIHKEENSIIRKLKEESVFIRTEEVVNQA